MSGRFAEAERVFGIEREWLDATLALVEDDFDRAVDLLASTVGRLLVCGMGKSGLVARKIASTLTSTGTPAYFLHAAEAVHGDLGLVSREDTVLILSKSGETPEIVALIPFFQRMGTRMVAMVSDPASTLARAAEVVLRLPDLPEACPHNLAPTASTTAMMALGDALAMALLAAGDFSPADFAEVHPGGTLGRRLLTRVRDLMTGPPLPVVPGDAPLSGAVDAMTGHRGVCLTVDEAGRLDGIFVYGDLGRLMKSGGDVSSLPLRDVVRRSPATATPDEPAGAALARMERRGITSLVVVDPDGRPLGLVFLHDLMRAGIR